MSQLRPVLKEIGNAIRDINGSQDLYTPDQMPNAIRATGSSSVVLNALIDRSITKIESNVDAIGAGAFAYCYNLTIASFPAATLIATGVFNKCSMLAELHLEGVAFCEAIGDPEINSTCKIYVPANLIEQYKTEIYWNKYATQFAVA